MLSIQAKLRYSMRIQKQQSLKNCDIIRNMLCRSKWFCLTWWKPKWIKNKRNKMFVISLRISKENMIIKMEKNPKPKKRMFLLILALPFSWKRYKTGKFRQHLFCPWMPNKNILFLFKLSGLSLLHPSLPLKGQVLIKDTEWHYCLMNFWMCFEL